MEGAAPNKKRPAPDAKDRGGKKSKKGAASWKKAAFKRVLLLVFLLASFSSSIILKKGAEAGHKGVLITCAKNRESECIREIYNLLNEVVNITTPCPNF